MKYFGVFFFVCLSFSCNGLGKNKTTKKYRLNDTYFLETYSQSNGKTWVLLCNNKTQICINIYPDIDHFNKIENIQIEKVVNDTAIFVTFYKEFETCTYREDTLLMSKLKVISKSVEKKCP